MIAALVRGLQDLSEHQGITIAVTGMVIVFLALTAIALMIALLPRALFVADRLRVRFSTRRRAPEAAQIIAAIAVALDQERRRGG